jgi:hypothetical protein
MRWTWCHNSIDSEHFGRAETALSLMDRGAEPIQPDHAQEDHEGYPWDSAFAEGYVDAASDVILCAARIERAAAADRADGSGATDAAADATDAAADSGAREYKRQRTGDPSPVFVEGWRQEALGSACRAFASAEICAWVVVRREGAAWRGSDGSDIPSLIAGVAQDLHIDRSTASTADAVCEWMMECQ